MKRVKPDLELLAKNKFIPLMRSSRKMRKLWPTTTVNGSEVFDRAYIDPSKYRAANAELLKFLGIHDEIMDASYKGLKNAWLYFNYGKNYRGKNSEEAILKNFIVNNLNKVFWNPTDGDIPEDLKIITDITLAPLAEGYTGDLTIDKHALLDANSSTMAYYFNNLMFSKENDATLYKGTYTEQGTRRIVENTSLLHYSDPWLYALSVYAPQCSDMNVTHLNTSRQYVKSTNQFGRNWYRTSYILNFEIPYVYFTTESEIVSKIYQAVKYIYSLAHTTSFDSVQTIGDFSPAATSNKSLVKTIISREVSYELDEGDDLVYTLRSYTSWVHGVVNLTNKYSDLWESTSYFTFIVGGVEENGYSVENFNYHFKVDALDNPRNYGFTRQELLSYLMSTIDSGYSKKRRNFFKAFIAVITVFIVAIYCAPCSAAIASALSLKVTGVVLLLTVMSIMLLALTLIATALGADDWASAFAVAYEGVSFLAIVAGIAKGVNNALKEATKETLLEMAKDKAMDLVNEMIKEVTSILNGNITAKIAIKYTNRLVSLTNYYQGKKLEELQDRNRDLLAEYEKMQEEEFQQSDVLKMFARIYNKPATADWSIYAGLYDLPYERGGGPLAIGNIQKTTKQAMRKGDYTMPVFNGIIGV